VDVPISTQATSTRGERCKYCRDHLDVFMPHEPVAVLVLDTCFRELHVTLLVRELVLARPPRDLLWLAVRPAVGVRSTAIALLEEPLVVALELVVQDDALDPPSLAAQALFRTRVGAIDPCVVREFAWLPKPCVKRLAGGVRSVSDFEAIGLEKVAPALCQHNSPMVGAEQRPLNQALTLEIPHASSGMAGIVSRS
jgi:hypothetical protein